MGPEASGLEVGDRVALEPQVPCWHNSYARCCSASTSCPLMLSEPCDANQKGLLTCVQNSQKFLVVYNSSSADFQSSLYSRFHEQYFGMQLTDSHLLLELAHHSGQDCLSKLYESVVISTEWLCNPEQHLPSFNIIPPFLESTWKAHIDS